MPENEHILYTCEYDDTYEWSIILNIDLIKTHKIRT